MAAPVDVSFRADISNLSQQLALIPGITKKEAKEMVKGLESEIKKAEKAAIKAAKNTEKAWGKTQGQFKQSKQATNELSDGMKGLKDQSGETDSVLKAFGGAIGTISPEAERAFTVLGDLSGGVEALARSSVGLIGPIALVTAAVGAGAFAWNHYKEELEEAEEKASNMAKAADDMAQAVSSFKADAAILELETLVATGEAEIQTLDRLKAERRAAGMLSQTRVELLKLETAAQEKLTTSENAHTEAIESAEFWGTSTLSLSHKRAQAKKQETLELDQARGKIEALDKKEAELVKTMIRGVEANRKSKDAKKGSAKATKDQTDAIGDLIEKVAAFDAPLSEFDQMADLLDEVTAATHADAAALERLEPVIAKLEQSMDRLSDTEASKELEKLSQEAGKFGRAVDPISEASELLARLKTEAEKSGAAFEALAPDIQRVGQHLEDLKLGEHAAKQSITGVGNLKDAIEDLKEQQKQYEEIHGTTSQAIADQERQLTEQMEKEAAARAQAYQNTFNNMAQAGSQFAQLRVQQIQKEAQEELEGRQHIAQSYEDGINNLNQAISAAETDKEKERLERMRGNLEKQLAAEEEAQAKIKEVKDAEILKAFRVAQAFNISTALMNSAVAITKVLADLGVAGPIAAVGIGALAAAQVATIAAQEPPTAHTGGMVGNSDEQFIKARTGEGVLTAQGVQAIGGAQGVANANAGMGGAGGQIVIQQVYRHRVLDTVIQDSINKGGPITQAINRRNKRGRRNPYRRSG